MADREPPDLSARSDRALVEAFQAGDAAAYDEIYRRHGDRVRKVCLRFLVNPQDAEEATQETFIKAYRGLARFNGRYYVGAWLARIATNVCLDQVRSTNKHNRVIVLPPDHDYSCPARGPEEELTGERLRLQESFGELQPLHATALMLRTVEGLSHREIAHRLHMSPGQVKALLHRARRSFKRAWNKVEGWAVAPVILMRRRPHGAPQANASHMPGVAALGQSAVPALAERVAAAGVLVAVALTGLPTTPGSPPISISPEIEGSVVEPRALTGSRPHAAEPARDETKESQSAAIAAPALIDEVDKMVGPMTEPPRPDGEDEPPDDDGMPPIPVSQKADKVVREVRKIVSKITPR